MRVHSASAILSVLILSAGCGGDDGGAAPASGEGAGGAAAAAGAGGAPAAGGGVKGGGGGTPDGGGQSGSGGSSAGGSGGGGNGGSDAGHAVGACTGLGAVGTWEDVTPPAVASSGMAGVLMVIVDPLDPATVYASSDHRGIFRSSDCGASWTKINTGRNGDVVDSGMLWVFQVDATDPNVMYTAPFQGTISGLFKSTNGGVDWDDLFTPGDNVYQALEYMSFQEVALDPTDRQHLVVTFHVNCKAPYLPLCMGESKDGGATWRVFNGPAAIGGWGEDAGPIVVNATTFCFAAPFDGLFCTTDSAVTWNKVASQGYQYVYRATNGWYYMGSAQAGIFRSQDFATWTVIPKTLTTVSRGLVGDGQRIFAAARAYVECQTSPESDGLTWTKIPGPTVTDGAKTFGYDGAHHILYSANMKSGLWRTVTY